MKGFLFHGGISATLYQQVCVAGKIRLEAKRGVKRISDTTYI